MEKTPISSCKPIFAPSTAHAPNMTPSPDHNTMSYKHAPNTTSKSAIEATDSISITSKSNSISTTTTPASLQKSIAHPYDEDNDDWGVPVQKVTDEQIYRLNGQSYTEIRVMLFTIVLLVLLVLSGAILVGLIKVWRLDLLVDEDLQQLINYSGVAANYFGLNAFSVAINYAYGAGAGCLCYILPYWLAYYMTFYYSMMWKKSDVILNNNNNNRDTAISSLLNIFKAEFYKFATMFVMLSLCFKFGSMPKDVMICSFVALIVLIMFFALLRGIFVTKAKSCS